MSSSFLSWSQVGLSVEEGNALLESLAQESKQRAEAEKKKKKEKAAANEEQTQQKTLSAAAPQEQEPEGKSTNNEPSGRFWLDDQDNKRVQENARRGVSPPCRSAASSSAAGEQKQARATRRSEHKKSHKLKEALAEYWKNAEGDKKCQAEKDKARRRPREDKDKEDGVEEPGRLLQSGGRWL